MDVPERVPPFAVSSTVRHNVFLVVKETLQNVVKHANATEVWLRIRAANSGLRIVIEDNGRGFNDVQEDALADGLRNMRQRMNEINGTFEIKSSIGHGTQVTIETPWGAP